MRTCQLVSSTGHWHRRANQTLEGAVCYRTVKIAAERVSCCDYTASTLPSSRTDRFIYSLCRYNRTASGLLLKNGNVLISILQQAALHRIADMCCTYQLKHRERTDISNDSSKHMIDVLSVHISCCNSFTLTVIVIM